MIGEISASQGTIRYRIDGSLDSSAATLLFINDILTDLRIWDPLVSELKVKYPSYRLLRYDLRSSPAESQNLTISSLTSNLHTLLTGTSSELSQTHLVGLGLGASIALSFLSKCPDSVASFTGISFAVPVTAAARSRQVSDWIDRATLAEKLGMRITADKAVSRWFTADQRDLEAWNTVKGMIESGTVSQFQGMVAAMIESLGADGDAEDGKVFRPVAILNRLETRPLFLAGSGDGVMPEDMESYPSLMKSGSGRFEIVRNAGRVFWWDESKMAQISEKFAALIDGNGKS